MAPNNSANETLSNRKPYQKHRPMTLQDLVAPCGMNHYDLSSSSSEERIGSEKSESRTTPNEDIPLGTYNASLIPLIVLFIAFVCGKITFYDYYEDPRVKGWALVDNEPGMIIISVTYIFFSMTWGPRLMEGRSPMQLKKIMIVYNAFQVVFSAYMFMEAGLNGWFFDYNLRCQPCDYSLNEKPVRMTHVAHYYFMSKILDFADTVLFILRGKLNQVTYLHVIHHSCMFMSMWFGLHHTPGGHITFMGFLNTFIHTVMYSYYLLAAMGPRIRPYLWWKKYLTRMQLIQFVLIFLHTAQLLVFPCEGVPPSLILWTMLYSGLFFALFINFYVKAYLRNRKRAREGKKETIISNGTTILSNGFHHANGSVVRPNGIARHEDRNGNITDDKTRQRLYNGISN